MTNVVGGAQAPLMTVEVRQTQRSYSTLTHRWGGKTGRLTAVERKTGMFGISHNDFTFYRVALWEIAPEKTLQQFSLPTLRFKALAFISQTDEWHSPRLLCVWIVSIPILRNDQTKGTHWEKRLTAVKIFFFFFFFHINNGSQMMFWCGLTHTNTYIHADTHTLNPSFLSSLFIIMLTLRVSLGRRQRGSLLFHKGRLISAKSVCASLLIPHHSCIVRLPGIRKSLISGIDWKCGKSASEAPSPGDSSPRAAGKVWRGKAEQRWRGRQKEEGFALLRAPEGYKAKAVLILRERRPGQAGFGFSAPLLYVTDGGLKTAAGYLLEGSMCLSLNDQSSSISDVLSLPVYHTERRAALICFRRQGPTQYCLYSPSLLRWHPSLSLTQCFYSFFRLFWDFLSSPPPTLPQKKKRFWSRVTEISDTTVPVPFGSLSCGSKHSSGQKTTERRDGGGGGFFFLF